MTPKSPPWPWQNKGGSPWYKSVRQYRKPSPEPDAWIPVIELIANDLKATVAERGLGQRAA